MNLLKPAIAATALVLSAGAADAATVNFEIDATVTRTGNIADTTAASGSVTVSGSFDTDDISLIRDGIHRVSDIFDLQVAGSLFDDMTGAYVHSALIVDEDPVAGTDLFRLMLRFDSGPSVNASVDYSFHQLSFYVPLASSTFDDTPFSEPGEGMFPELAVADNGREANFVSVWRVGATDRTGQAFVNGDVSNFDFTGNNPLARAAITPLNAPAVPVPASVPLLLGGLALLGGVARRARR